MAKKSNFNLSSPLIYIVLGALLVIFNIELLKWAMTAAGIFFIVMGILDLIKNRIPNGIVNLAIGIIIIVFGWLITDIVLKVLGVLIAAKGVMDLIAVLKLKNKSILGIVFAALTIAIGVMLVIDFGDVIGKVIKVIGVLLIVDGILGLVGAAKQK